MNKPELFCSPNLVSLPPHHTGTKNSFPVTQQLNEQAVGGNKQPQEDKGYEDRHVQEVMDGYQWTPIHVAGSRAWVSWEIGPF